jgi:uncharacterized protein (DUF736 family)
MAGDFRHKENSGTLFKNDRKTTDKQPDYKGTGNYQGKEVEISGWIKEGAKGKFISLSFQEPWSKRQSSQQPTQVNNKLEDVFDDEDESPF